MRSRCNNPKAPKYPAYGGSGISVCERWEVFANFLEDMGERPAGTTLDRINGELGYFKENCRWATTKVQQRNIKRNVFLTLRGKTQCIKDWAEELGIDPMTLKYRVKQGWSENEIMLPPGARNQQR